jgi:hypothetical protein
MSWQQAGALLVAGTTALPSSRISLSVRQSRIGEGAGELGSDAAVRVDRESRGVGQLVEPEPVGAHREDLGSARRVGAERVTRRVEDDRMRHRILEEDPIVPVCAPAVRRRPAESSVEHPGITW